MVCNSNPIVKNIYTENCIGGIMTSMEPQQEGNRDLNKDSVKSQVKNLGPVAKNSEVKLPVSPMWLDELKSGTGYMQTLSEAITKFEKLGYRENLIGCVDHLRSQCRKIKILPEEIDVKDIYRFENSSDPEDQSILYVISVPSKDIKGLYVESYGLYHEDQSDTLRKALRLNR
jgi:hypothetical protein